MNMSPKVRPLWQRLLLMFGTRLLWAYKVLHLPRFILPRDIKSVVKNWTHEMFWMLIKSRFTERISISRATSRCRLRSSRRPRWRRSFR